MNFKIRVVENIGSDSVNAFGHVGNELSVQYGALEDLEGYEWNNCNSLLHDIEEVNEFFSEDDSYQTVFELVESEE